MSAYQQREEPVHPPAAPASDPGPPVLPVTLRDHFAGISMGARVTAAWSNSHISLKAWKRHCEESGQRVGFREWMLLSAYEDADIMLKVRDL
jgi:hypothetical protein